ncbi:Hypothetical predicted protein [Olea europaea subsp. europaea]|uniref:Uncharacterized protein n=1 Tax=Olea europaea subsp. europaea TaxID=158383 RepID=A0A8S0SXZ5_OLEEU|nr:Hypothetical predicted protein [Olea europaea subsp. europaea]
MSSPRIRLRHHSNVELQRILEVASTGSNKRKKTKVPGSDMGMVAAPILQSPQQLHMPLPFSYTNILLGRNQNLQFTQHLQSTCLNPSLTTTPTLNMQGLGMHFDGRNTDAPTEVGSSITLSNLKDAPIQMMYSEIQDLLKNMYNTRSKAEG